MLRIIFLRCLILFLRATEACQLAECLVKMPEAYKETSLFSNQNTQKKTKTQRGQEKRKENDLLCFPSAAPTGNGKAHEDHFVSFALFCF